MGHSKQVRWCFGGVVVEIFSISKSLYFRSNFIQKFLQLYYYNTSLKITIILISFPELAVKRYFCEDFSFC